MRDCFYERDTAIGYFEERNSGNDHLNEPRTVMKKLIFSVHEKHQANRLSRIQGAVGLFSDTLELLRDNENYIRGEVANLPKFLNGPQVNKTSKTAASVEMLNSLENLQQVSELHPYDALNLMSCKTLDVKNIKFIFLHHKDKPFTVVYITQETLEMQPNKA